MAAIGFVYVFNVCGETLTRGANGLSVGAGKFPAGLPTRPRSTVRTRWWCGARSTPATGRKNFSMQEIR
jgi:hypothetical protein